MTNLSDTKRVEEAPIQMLPCWCREETRWLTVKAHMDHGEFGCKERAKYVYCQNCWACGPARGTYAKAVEAWNKMRSSLLQQPVTSERCDVSVTGQHRVDVPYCKDCGKEFPCVYPATGAPLSSAVEIAKEVQRRCPNGEQAFGAARVVSALETEQDRATTNAVEGAERDGYKAPPYTSAHRVRYILSHEVHPDIVVLWFLALKSHWFDDPNNMFFGMREHAKAYLYKWIETGEPADDNTTLEIAVKQKFSEWLASSWTATPPVPTAAEKCPICGDPAPAGACCGGYACKKPPTVAPATDTNDEVARLRAELERLSESEQFWKIATLAHFCCGHDGTGSRKIARYCAGCGAPMKWRTSEQRKTYDELRAELEAAQRRSYAHMCCDGHHEIGFNDPEDKYGERCPCCSEIDRLVDGVRDELIRLGVPDERIDGAGCDSGDPLDFMQAEIMQAFSYIEDQNVENEAKARTTVISEVVDKCKAIANRYDVESLPERAHAVRFAATTLQALAVEKEGEDE